MDSIIMQPIVQYGFLGFSAVLLGIVVWLITRLLRVLEGTSPITAASTEASKEQTRMIADLLNLNRSLHDKIISRPCIASKED